MMTSGALGYEPTPETPTEPTKVLVIENTPNVPFQIIDETENSDGSLDLTLKMDHETLVHFAKIGLRKVIEDAANRVIADNGPTQ